MGESRRWNDPRADTLAFNVVQDHACPEFRSGCVLCGALRAFEAGERPVGLDVPAGLGISVERWHGLVKHRLLIAAGKRRDPGAEALARRLADPEQCWLPLKPKKPEETKSAWQAKVRAAHNERRGWTAPNEERSSILADKASALAPLMEEASVGGRGNGRKTLALVLAGLHELGGWMSGRGQISHERLACATGASRATVKRALRRLRAAGLIVSTQTTARASRSRRAREVFEDFGMETDGRQGANIIQLSEEVVRICQAAHRARRRKTGAVRGLSAKKVSDPPVFPQKQISNSESKKNAPHRKSTPVIGLQGAKAKRKPKQPGLLTPELKRRARQLAKHLERLATPFMASTLAPALPTAQWCVENGLKPDDVCRLVEDVGWRAPDKIHSWKYFLPELRNLPTGAPDARGGGPASEKAPSPEPPPVFDGGRGCRHAKKPGFQQIPRKQERKTAVPAA